MNPYELERLAKQHTGELRKAAGRRRAGAARPGRVRSIRHRAGWALVQVGLALISTSASGTGNGPALQTGFRSSA